jgi:hypothetical protein
MTYLELVQRLQLESGLGGSPIQSFSGQRGMALRLVKWVAEAEGLILARWTDWNFLWATATPIITADGASDYAPDADLNTHQTDSLLLDGNPIGCEDYRPGVFTDSTRGQPFMVLRLPNRQIRLYPTPNRDYTLTGNYFRKPVLMKAEADTSVIPAHFHTAIVWQALWLYANFDNAAESKQQAQENLAQYMMAMEAQELPGRSGHKLASAGLIEVRPQ